jgi:hypothetical protein
MSSRIAASASERAVNDRASAATPSPSSHPQLGKHVAYRMLPIAGVERGTLPAKTGCRAAHYRGALLEAELVPGAGVACTEPLRLWGEGG